MLPSRVYGVLAFAANLVIAGANAVAWGLTGSASMLAQTYHALGNASHQLLIAAGRDPEQRRGGDTIVSLRRRRLLAVTVVALVFAIAGYAAFRDGFNRFGTPYRNVNQSISYLALGSAAVVQFLLFEQGYRREDREDTDMRALLSPPSPAAVRPSTGRLGAAVAFVGIAVAFAGVFVSDTTGNMAYDATASMVIGLLLLGMALAVVYQHRMLIVGTDPGSTDAIRAALEKTDGVAAVRDLHVVATAPGELLVTAEVEPESDVSDETVREAARDAVRNADPEATRIYLETSDTATAERSLNAAE